MTAEVEQARREVDIARGRLVSSIAALQAALLPARLASKAWKGVRDKGEDVADEALQAVRSRPVAAGGAVAALFLLLARKPIGRLVSGALSREDDAEEKKDDPVSTAPSARRRRKKE